MRTSITPITSGFGVELDEVPSPQDLHDLLVDSLVVVIRGQHLSHAEQVALARAIGEPTPAHPVVPGHPDHPEILELDGARGGKNAKWHTDVTFSVTPPAASVLCADVLPQAGGDTLWADLRGAYEALSPAMKDLVDGLEAVHRISPLAYWGYPHDSALSREDAQQLLDDAAAVPPVIHPVVRVHPVDGSRSLFVNPGFTTRILGLSEIESEGLLQILFTHATRPEFVLRHRWEPGDVVLWDNRATMHYASDDYGDATRRMRRVTLRGARPFGIDGTESRLCEDPFLAIA